MRRSTFRLTAALSLSSFIILTAVIGCSGPSSSGLPSSGTYGVAQTSALTRFASQGKIKHIVVIVQENRTFDNFFDCFPGTDCVTTAPGPGAAPGPHTIQSPCPVLNTPTPGPTSTPITLKMDQPLLVVDPAHNYCPGFKTEYDNGRMDGFYYEPSCFGSNPYCETYVFRVTKRKQIQPYWDMATQYVLADRAFPTQSSGSFTAHQDLIRGDTTYSTDESLVDFPWSAKQPTNNNWGCDDASDAKTPLLGADLSYNMNGPFPCLTYQTIRDLIEAKGLTWKYYVPPWPADGGQMWNAFDAISSVRKSKEWPGNGGKPFNCSTSCVAWPNTIFFCDMEGSTSGKCPAPRGSGSVGLPAISWVIPTDQESDHYAFNKRHTKQVDYGPDWVTSVVNAVGESKYWNSTAIVLMWDDWGGFYDHIPPPQLDYKGLGFRVPFIIISPYAKKGYLTHTQYEVFGSTLKFIETTFGLGSLGTTDQRANNITDSFDFSQKPRAFVPIAPLNKNETRHFFVTLPRDDEPVDSE